MTFALNRDLDEAAIGASLAADGRAQIRDFLEPQCAERLLQHLQAATDWRHVLNAGDNVYEIDCRQLDTMTGDQRVALDHKADRAASEGFQFRFDTIRVPDDHEDRIAAKQLLAEFALFMSSEPVVSWLRTVTGSAAIDFADCQATRYRNGAFLTRHDDAIEGKQRHYAYVLGLTKQWQAEWGGLLTFPGHGEISIEALVPEFNLLTLFEVGQPHFVSQVASYAPAPRISVTGWLRSSPKD